MQLPTLVFGHSLAYGKDLTPDILERNLAKDRELGFCGEVILPVLMARRGCSPSQMAKVFKRAKMQGLVCGFNPGDGPSPYVHPRLVLKELERQAGYAVKLAEAGLGPPVFPGPLHTHYRQPLPDGWTKGMLSIWLDGLDALAKKLSLKFLLEALNDVEDKTPTPFELLWQGAASREHLGLHLDLGHFHSRGHTPADFGRMAGTVGLVEFANVGRDPLDMNRGIDFPAFVGEMGDRLLDDCLVANEPFCQEIIKAFGLRELCDTIVPGEEALARNAEYLKKLGVMAKTA